MDQQAFLESRSSAAAVSLNISSRPFALLADRTPLKRKQKPDRVKVKWKVGDEALVRLPMPRTTYLEREARVVQLVTTLLQETP